MKKVVVLFLSLMLLLGFLVIVDLIMDFTPKVGGSTLYVNETGGGGAFTSIQDAINAGNDGDTIFVYNGTYIENILVNKTINLTGKGWDETTIDGGWSGGVIRVTSDWVNITGFTITNGYYAIRLESSNNTISDNNISYNGDNSLYLDISSNNTISDNIVSNNGRAIYLKESSNNTISNNNISYNDDDGIALRSSVNNNITGNSISFNNGYGIDIQKSPNNNLINNNFSNDGIMINGIQLSHFDTHNIPLNNIVNGKSIYYIKNTDNVSFDGTSLGQLILVNCTGFKVKNLHINDTDVGIIALYSPDNLIVK